MESFTPIPFEYYEIVEEFRQQGIASKVHFFLEGVEIESAEGAIDKVVKEKDGDFLVLNPYSKIRLDKIITIFGKPGPAYGIYDSFANACMDCMGGMD